VKQCRELETLKDQELQKSRELQEEVLKRIEFLERKIKEKDMEIKYEREASKRQMEQIIKVQREYEQMKQKPKELIALESMPSDQKEAAFKEVELQKYRSIVRCSMCSFRMKNVVLAKCMHSFCNECVKDCLANRNRKCPKCNHKFSQVDVKQLWLDD